MGVAKVVARHCNGFVWSVRPMVLGLALSSCASQVPLAIREAPPEQPTIVAARDLDDRDKDVRVRWGGELVRVTNLAQQTELEILGRALGRDGEPDAESAAQGRFILIWKAFLDPADYRPGQRITTSGTLSGTRSGQVGEFAYRYPVVMGDVLYRWPEVAPVELVAPYYGWPYDDPWWPYGPYWRRGYW